MTTLEMMNEAAKTGKVYVAYGQIKYSRGRGFRFLDATPMICKDWSDINSIFKVDQWIEHTITKMTKQEAEKKYGIEIILED